MTKKTDVPPYKLRKSTGQAYAVFDGKRKYFGRYELPESRAKYDQFVAEWLAAGRRVRVTASDLSIAELCAAFKRHAEMFYRKPDGTPTGTAWNCRAATGFLDRLYGTMDVAAFTPQALKAVRQAMIRADWCRKTANQGVNLVRSVFRWGVAEGMVPVAVHTALTTCDHRMDRCLGAGLVGDATNAVLAAAGSNLRKLLRRLAAALIRRLPGTMPPAHERYRPTSPVVDKAKDAVVVDTAARLSPNRPSPHRT